MIYGINQGGKTYHACHELKHYLEGTHPYRTNIPNAKFLVMAPSRDQVTDVWGQYLLKAANCPGISGDYPILNLDDYEVVYDTSIKPWCPKLIKNKRTGSVARFGWSAHGLAQNFLEGKQFDGAFIDESAGTQALIDELLPRLLASRTKHGPDAGFILWGATQTKVNIAQENFLLNCRNPDIPEYQAFTVDGTDNIASVSMEAREETAKGMSPEAASIRMQGGASALDMVLVYPVISNFRERFVRMEPYEWDPRDNLYASYDPGIDHPCGLALSAISRHSPQKHNITNFLCQSGQSLVDHISWLKQALMGRKLAGFLYDKHGNARDKGTGLRLMDQCAELMDHTDLWATPYPRYIRPKQLHDHGITRVRTYLDPPAEVYHEPMVGFDPATMDNGIARMVEQMCMYRGREDKNFTGSHGVIKKNDEGPDCLRYLCVADIEWNEDWGGGMMNAPHSALPADVTSFIDAEELSAEQIEKMRKKRLSADVGRRWAKFR